MKYLAAITNRPTLEPEFEESSTMPDYSDAIRWLPALLWLVIATAFISILAYVCIDVNVRLAANQLSNPEVSHVEKK